MKYAKHILASVIVFILGLEIGGFAMWYNTLKALSPESNKRHDERPRHVW